MSFDIAPLYRHGLPAPAAAPFSGYPAYNFVGGHNDAGSIPVAALRDAADRVIAAEGHTLATYGLNSGPQGYLPLRQFIADTLAASAGMTDTADNVLITGGSLQALDLVNSLLLNPGDHVVAEEASYGGALTRLAVMGVNYRAAPMDRDGIEIAPLRAILEQQRAAGQPVKFIYTIPTVQNPTGGVMSLERRHQLLDLAAEFDCLIFEDDCYADLLWGAERPPTLRALDAAPAAAEGRVNRVIYCGSFSKSVAPALRIGYIMADWPVLAQILPLKTDAGTGALDQMILAEFCRDHFDAHVTKLRQTLHDKCDVIMAALDKNFGAAAEYDAPLGGIFIWVTLPPEVDTSKLAVAAQKQGIALNPGAEWTVDGAANRHRLRLCFGHPEETAIRDGVARLAQVCHAEFGVPRHIANTAPG